MALAVYSLLIIDGLEYRFLFEGTNSTQNSTLIKQFMWF